MEQLKTEKVVIPESVVQAAAMVEVVQGKGAVSAFAIEQSTLAATGIISFDGAVKAIIEHD
jgi:hypothetical protein